MDNEVNRSDRGPEFVSVQAKRRKLLGDVMYRNVSKYVANML